jgi:formylglycine-generating enzyme required for sulfatase activity
VVIAVKLRGSPPPICLPVRVGDGIVWEVRWTMNRRAWFWTEIVVAGACIGAAVLARSGARADGPGGTAAGCSDLDGDGYGIGCAAGPDCNETGAADERPVHRVAGSAFVIDRYEVTNGRYAACVRAGACVPPSLASSNMRPHYFDDAAFADYPVIFVSWPQAQAFCAFAGGRLPTEAEWERAAAGSEQPRTYPWGESPPDCAKANFAGCVGDTDRVGRRLAGQSPYGAFDMAGNVWEWTADFYDAGYYRQGPAQDPTGPATGTLKVMRGGCWVSGESTLRTTCRKAGLPGSWAPNVGFRCAYPEARP